MPACKSVRCGRWAQDDWECCAHCGDPISGKRAANESECSHNFVIEGRYCVTCGYDPEVGDKGERAALLLFGVGLLLVGLTLAGGSLLFLTRGAVNPENRGPRYLGYATVVGVILIGLGLAKILKALRISD